MEYIRDPAWQFVGVIITLISMICSAIAWHLGQRKLSRKTEAELIQKLKARMHVVSVGSAGKHKKRKDDGVLLGNLSSDFFNQFPLPIAVLAAHLDRIYTPENFGASDWLVVFKRLCNEGFFVPANTGSPKRLRLESEINTGPKFQKWHETVAKMKRSIQGLE